MEVAAEVVKTVVLLLVGRVDVVIHAIQHVALIVMTVVLLPVLVILVVITVSRTVVTHAIGTVVDSVI